MEKFKVVNGVGIIPEGTKAIEGAWYKCAFENSETLTSIIIPNSVTKIGNDAFYNCISLTNIVIPDSVTEIKSSAFYGCTGLTSIVIPDSVTKISARSGSTPGAFDGCTGLTSIIVSKGNKVYDSRNNCNAIIETETNKLLLGCNNTVIPDKVTEIEEGAFCGCAGLTSIIIPATVSEIGKYAFEGCTGLTSIVLSESLTKIENHAFSGCTGLTSLVIPDSVTEIGYSAFNGCTNLKSIVIPDSVTEIGDEAFEGCTGLQSITIPDSVTKIGNHAFSGCANLTSIVIPGSVTKIGSFAFENCSGLKSIIVSKDNKVYDSRENCNAIIETEKNALEFGCINTVIPSSVVGISMGAFWGSGLTSIVIPATVSWINRGVFSGSRNLKSIVVEEGNPKYNSRDNCNAIIDRDNWLTEGCATTVIPESVVLIGEEAFKDCTGLTTIVIPKSVREIREYAFRGCTGLTSIVIPASVTKIDKYAFEGSRLTKIVVEEGNPTYDSRNDCNAIIETADNRLMLGFAASTIPDTVTEIGKRAFYERKGLTNIIIPKSVKTIEGDAFWGCTDLKSVSILGPVKKLEETFSRCSALETVTLGVGIKTIKENAFNFCTSLKTIYVPAKKVDYYKERLPESLHSLIVELPAEKKAKKK